jgi:uncharacterized SAM-binding protein YcdF (DUF218 family)
VAVFVAACFVPLAIVFAAREPLLRNLARWLVRTDEPVPSDLIVVLGGESGFRVTKAAELWESGYATRIALTGPDPEFPELEQPSYVRWLHLLDRVQVPRDSVDVLHPSHSTLDDARLIREVSTQRGIRSILVVTDPYHTRRSGWVIRRMLEGSGIGVRVISSTPPWYKPERWWKDERQILFVGMEYLKMAYYAKNYGWSGPLSGEARGVHGEGRY